MMTIKTAARFGCMLVVSWATLAAGGDRGPGEILFVDGIKTEAEILFTHPHAPLLIVRSPNYRTAQSFPLSLIQSYTVEGRVTQVNPARALTEEEKQERERNSVWGASAGPGQAGNYATETWERRPLVVWARPGESGDALDPANWLDENGNTLEQLHWEAGPSAVQESGGPRLHWEAAPSAGGSFAGDILMPAAETRYSAVQSRSSPKQGAFEIRHLTIERNARYSVRSTIRGNFWMKDGSKMGWLKVETGGPHITRSLALGGGNANKHTVARFVDSHDDTRLSGNSHFMELDAGDKGSVEVIGISGGGGDRIWLHRGTLIVAKNSALPCGNRAAFYTAPGTTLVLLDGATIGSPARLKAKHGNTMSGTYGIGGTIMFGTPERPLTRDLEFGATLYPMEELNKQAAPSTRAVGASWVFGPASRAVIHSADPARARVVFGPRDRAVQAELEGKASGAREKPKGQPDVPKGVVAVFRGQTEFDGVVFDGFYEGGIVVDPAARAQWRNVFFGTNNLAAPEKLFSSLE